MKAHERYPYFLNKIIVGMNAFIGMMLGMMLLFLLLRVGEYAVLRMLHDITPNTVRLQAGALLYDLVFFSKLAWWMLIQALIGYALLDIRVVNFLLLLTILLGGLVYIGLIQYFTQALVPLGADLFGYSREEIEQTVGASGAVSLLGFIPYLLFMIAAIYLLFFLRKCDYPRVMLFVLLAVCTLHFIFPQYEQPESKKFNTDMEYYLASNKLAYFSNSTAAYFDHDAHRNFDGFYYDDLVSTQYTDPKYPFLHIDSTADVLGNYFDRFDGPPNLVFIIVESLGKAYSGKNAYLGSFTPFLDSLAGHGLYWENFLSNGGRTFAVLPSVFASLPFGEQGFLELGEKMPPHQSMIRLLKANGYHTAFYHGGQAKFDNMKLFLQRQDIDFIQEEDNFGGNYSKMPANEGGFTWGYGDLELFKCYFELKKPMTGPRLEIFLTVSNHSPFKVNNQSRYQAMFEQRMVTLGISEARKNECRKYKDMYSCIMYSDDAIRQFINDYSKRPDFKNTIFVITGDHRMPEIPIATKIDRFHVPLIVYSPKLNRTATFSSVSTHMDITPTFLAFLKHHYEVKIPEYAAWVGNGIDTARLLRNTHSVAMMRNKNQMVDYIDYGNFLSEEQVYIIENEMNIDVNNNQQVLNTVKAKFNTFKTRNEKSVLSLLPDSIVNFKP
jgi:phosphoglycerol transferase MdoB-like AlkP superfamily enzyme